ncbi:MAG: hypothetical protein OXQ94_17875 [Gemmatimonadota bacterium]|nr:hypothetical protein [Gemmatimonadota bacterium]MDE2873547.1 hypothetical protein [Gemmatimonadota bacterium]
MRLVGTAVTVLAALALATSTAAPAAAQDPPDPPIGHNCEAEWFWEFFDCVTTQLMEFPPGFACDTWRGDYFWYYSVCGFHLQPETGSYVCQDYVPRALEIQGPFYECWQRELSLGSQCRITKEEWGRGPVIRALCRFRHRPVDPGMQEE